MNYFAKKSFMLMALILGISFKIGISAVAAPLRIDFQRSEIEVKARTTVNSFTARLQTFKADIDYGMNTNLPDAASVTFDFKDLNTGIKLRNQHMLEWLQYSTNTVESFNLTGWTHRGTNDVALGTISIHGVSQTIEIPVNATRDHDQCKIAGQAELDYRKFGLPVIRQALFFSVNPGLTVAFHLYGDLSPLPKTSL